MFHADGQLADGPIALCEVQGYVFAAREAAAQMAEALGHPQLASRWLQQAERLAERFNAAFWSDDLGTCVLALDGMKQPCQVRSSNAGQVLLSGIASQPQAAAVAAQLMSQPFFSGWDMAPIETTSESLVLS